ncbi:uncharacterized protein BDZ99DRAFT_523371 [Mytilinidion resinicola]|uniref:Uncharacterized protein n=1 Tax=Mytilinidion resinicola TaxID=574789 RepID=A0A6A6YDA4_9PEZI|nr:uncharacterized protein BDZ99DRAFT_523371 [Mytilinidion resinicola]KAF2806802.1 hypothetical protein BDZ99DRAFT_523371 [Mytilinidion resinicola]
MAFCAEQSTLGLVLRSRRRREHKGIERRIDGESRTRAEWAAVGLRWVRLGGEQRVEGSCLLGRGHGLRLGWWLLPFRALTFWAGHEICNAKLRQPSNCSRNTCTPREDLGSSAFDRESVDGQLAPAGSRGERRQGTVQDAGIEVRTLAQPKRTWLQSLKHRRQSRRPTQRSQAGRWDGRGLTGAQRWLGRGVVGRAGGGRRRGQNAPSTDKAQSEARQQAAARTAKGSSAPVLQCSSAPVLQCSNGLEGSRAAAVEWRGVALSVAQEKGARTDG